MKECFKFNQKVPCILKPILFFIMILSYHVYRNIFLQQTNTKFDLTLTIKSSNISDHNY